MSDILLSGRAVTQRFGGLTAVNEVHFDVERNKITSIIGPNGAGKTTLFNCITGIYTPTSGSILYKENDITGMKPYKIASMGVARTFQNIRLFAEMTVIENVIVGTHTTTKANLFDVMFRLPRHKSEEREAEEKAERILEQTGLLQHKYSYATSLPYGLQRRLEIARALASEPELLLFDEPAAGMNEQETDSLMEFIHEIKDMGYTVLLIEHDMKLVMAICDKIYVLDQGELIAQGAAEDIKANQRVIEAYLGKEA